MLAFRIFDDSGFSNKLRAVPEDEQGIDIDFLQKEIKKSEEKAIKDGNNEPVSPDFSCISPPWSKLLSARSLFL